jgi:hypothetical protein
LGSSEYQAAQRRVCRLKASNDEIRWGQGVIALADEILDLTPSMVSAMKSEHLQTLEERASVESEDETEQG